MPFPKLNAGSSSGFLDEIKSKLGFASNSAYPGAGHSRYGSSNGSYDNYDDVDDYDDYEDEEDVPQTNSFNNNSVVTTRQSGTARHSSATGFRPAKLVSIDDVRSRTSTSGASASHTSPAVRNSSYSATRTQVGASGASVGYSQGNATGNKERSESLDSLFSSTGSTGTTTQTENANVTQREAGSSYKQPSVYSRGTSNSQRSVSVIKPTSYEQCEGVTKALKGGNVCVLALSSTDPALARRVLDFAFGAASALSASVDCPADKVFVISRGAALSTAERQNLAKQGIL